MLGLRGHLFNRDWRVQGLKIDAERCCSLLDVVRYQFEVELGRHRALRGQVFSASLVGKV